MGHSNAYLVVNGEHSALVDAGVSGKLDKITDALKSQDLTPNDVNLIIMTHTHYDHCGTLSELKELTGAQIVVQSEEASNLREGFTPLPRGTRWYSKAIVFLGDRLLPSGAGSFDPVEPDIVVEESCDLNQYGLPGTAVHTPGHTAGSMSILVDGEHALVGDTMFHIFKNSAMPPLANDVPELLGSWERLLETGCERFYPGHGSPFSRDLLKASLEKEKKKYLR
jgi:glyoxylase-like metal-dependent hydrolase (beta-lactamase superfamily II)